MAATKEVQLTEQQTRVISVLRTGCTKTAEIAKKVHLPIIATDRVLMSLKRMKTVSGRRIMVPGPMQWKIN